MSGGLLALLDDVAALVKASAVSLDDISAQVAKTGSKVSGIVIDDAAVTPKYVVGLDPSRELSIIYKIAKSSIINKLIFLAPAILLLGYFAPWIIQPILMVGGCYLCFEGYEKLHEIFFGHHHHANDKDQEDKMQKITTEELEAMRVNSAVRTDFILSAEIIAITYSTVATSGIALQIATVVIVAIAITVLVYGAVGLIVKADDFGLFLARKDSSFLQNLGRGIVKIMPGFLKVLSYIGTAAMLWVGAEIIIHGIPPLEHIFHEIEYKLEAMPVVAWLVRASAAAICGIVFGFIVAKIVGLVAPLFGKKTHASH